MHTFLKPVFKPGSIFVKPLCTGNTAIVKPQPGRCFFNEIGIGLQLIQGSLLSFTKRAIYIPFCIASLDFFM
jgi:hypothetical protein